MRLRRSCAITFLALSTPTLAYMGCAGDDTAFFSTLPDGGDNDSGSSLDSAPANDASRSSDSGDTDAGDSGTDGGPTDGGPSVYAVSAQVDGLVSGGGLPAQGLVLRNNGGDDLHVSADGTFPFAHLLSDGARYSVTVYSNPNGRSCTVEKGSGTIAAAAVTVKVHCAAVTTYTVGGEVHGLAPAAGGQPAQGLVLQNNSGDDLPIVDDGLFTFSHQLPSGATYAVTVKTQPAARKCKVTNASGTVQGAAVTSVQVSCNAS